MCFLLSLQNLHTNRLFLKLIYSAFWVPVFIVTYLRSVNIFFRFDILKLERGKYKLNDLCKTNALQFNTFTQCHLFKDNIDHDFK